MIPDGANIIPLTNIIFYTNNNKTLPLGMNVSTQVLIDMKKFNFMLVEENKTKINVESGRYVETKKINIYKYKAYLKVK